MARQAWWLVAALLLVSFPLYSAQGQSDSPISIDGNSALQTYVSDNGLAGDGSAGDPFVIENLDINFSGNHGIEIRNTDLHLVLRNITLTGTSTVNEDGVYLESSSHVLIDDVGISDAGSGINVIGCLDIEIRNVRANDSVNGIRLADSRGTNISFSSTLNNQVGIQLRNSTSNQIHNGTIHNSSQSGMLIFLGSDDSDLQDLDIRGADTAVLISGSDGFQLRNSTVSDSNEGIKFETATGVVAGNLFLNNTVHAQDDGSNFFDAGYPTGGNHWDNHSTTDSFSGSSQDQSGSDGIIDSAFIIDGDSSDRYPLPPPPAPDTTPPSSMVDTVAQYWTTSSSLPLTASASDDQDGVDTVDLWYVHSVDNNSFSAPAALGDPQPAQSGSAGWSFVFPAGGGHYRLWSRALDLAGNLEAEPSSPDLQLGYDAAPAAVSWLTPSVDALLAGHQDLIVVASTGTISVLFEYSREGGEWQIIGTDTTSGDGWSWNWTIGSLPEANYTLRATATNDLGRTASAERDVSVGSGASPTPSRAANLAGEDRLMWRGEAASAQFSLQNTGAVDLGVRIEVAGPVWADLTDRFVQLGLGATLHFNLNLNPPADLTIGPALLTITAIDESDQAVLDQTTINLTVLWVDLLSEMIPDPVPIEAGKEATLTVVVTNRAPFALPRVAVSLVIPDDSIEVITAHQGGVEIGPEATAVFQFDLRAGRGAEEGLHRVQIHNGVSGPDLELKIYTTDGNLSVSRDLVEDWNPGAGMLFVSVILLLTTIAVVAIGMRSQPPRREEEEE